MGTSPREPRISMIIGMPWMHGRFGGSCSFLSTSISSAGSVIILKCYRGVMEVATINKQAPVLSVVSKLFLILPHRSLQHSLHYSILLHLQKKISVHHQGNCYIIHSITMTRRGRGPKRRAIDKAANKTVPEALLRHFGRYVDHCKEAPLEGENAAVGANIAETDLTIKLPVRYPSLHAIMRILENSRRTLPLLRPS